MNEFQPMNPDLLAVAARVVWFEPPEKALADSRLFLAHVMTYGTLEDVLLVRQYYTEQAFRDALVHAPAGVFDPRSWAYWHTAFHLPIPPLPTRFS